MRRRLSPRASAWRWLILLPGLSCAACSGGADELNPVKGKLLYNNEPLKGAVVTFHPKGEANEVTAVRPVGLTGEDGTFTLTTGSKAGARSGAYVVTVICSEEVAPKNSKVISTAPPDAQDRFRGAYADRAKSTIEIEIKKGTNELEPINLK